MEKSKTKLIIKKYLSTKTFTNVATLTNEVCFEPKRSLIRGIIYLFYGVDIVLMEGVLVDSTTSTLTNKACFGTDKRSLIRRIRDKSQRGIFLPR